MFRSIFTLAALCLLVSTGGCDGGAPGPSMHDGGARPAVDAAPRTPERRCTGLARDCSVLSEFSCTSQDGCRVDGECDGFASPCSSFFSSTTCIGQGCFWSSSDRRCSGSPRSCLSRYSELSCLDVEGCRWEPTCDGYATSCILIDSQAACLAQDGCRWE